MRPKKPKSRSILISKSILIYITSLIFLKNCDVISGSNTSRVDEKNIHQFNIYGDEDSDIEVIDDEETLLMPDFYSEDDFLTPFEQKPSRSLPNYENKSRDKKRKGENSKFPVSSSENYDYPFEGGGDIHTVFNSMNESGTVYTTGASILARRLDRESSVNHRVFKNMHQDFLGPPPPPPIPPPPSFDANSRISPLILNEVLHGKPISAVIIPNVDVTGTPPGPPPPPPPAPTLMIPKKMNGKPKVPGFDIFDHRKRQYGMCKNLYDQLQ